MNHWLVVIDTTNRPFDARGFKPGIQNFYICLAPDANSAKNMVLNTFRQNPAVIPQLINSTYVTPLQAISQLLTPAQSLWSYVPMGGMRAPGQQKKIPSPDSLLRPEVFDVNNPNPIARTNEEFRPSTVEPKKPEVYEVQAQRDIKANTKPMDPMDALLSDPTFKAKLMAKLLGGDATPDAEAAMRFTESADDDLTALPPDAGRQQAPTKVALPEKVPAVIQGLTKMEPGQADAELQAKIRFARENLRKLSEGIIDNG